MCERRREEEKKRRREEEEEREGNQGSSKSRSDTVLQLVPPRLRVVTLGALDEPLCACAHVNPCVCV